MASRMCGMRFRSLLSVIGSLLLPQALAAADRKALDAAAPAAWIEARGDIPLEARRWLLAHSDTILPREE